MALFISRYIATHVIIGEVVERVSQMKKVLYVTTVSSTISFLTDQILYLFDEGYLVDIACRVTGDINRDILAKGCVVYDVSFRRSPLTLDNLRAVKQLRQIIQNNGYDVVHVHTPIAAAIARYVCKNIPKIKVMYTAHGFHFYKGAPLLNWLVYYPVERYFARHTDILITINKEDYVRARNFKAKNTVYVPGVGVDVHRFENVVIDRQQERLELGLPLDSIVLLSVGELNSNKNHEVVIKALAQLRDKGVYYLVCGRGSKEAYLKELAERLGVGEQVRLLGFRKDIERLCALADVFVFPSFREGLSVALMEAMASGLPVICSNIRGNVDLIHDGQGGILVKRNSPEEYCQAIKTLINDELLRETLGSFNKKAVKPFGKEEVKLRMAGVFQMIEKNL